MRLRRGEEEVRLWSTVNTVPSSHVGHRQLRLSSVKMHISHMSQEHLEVWANPQEFPPWIPSSFVHAVGCFKQELSTSKWNKELRNFPQKPSTATIQEVEHLLSSSHKMSLVFACIVMNKAERCYWYHPALSALLFPKSRRSLNSSFSLFIFLWCPPRSLWIDRNVSLLCHRGDPLLVAGEFPACQRQDCFHSPEQVAAFLLVKWSWPHRRSPPLQQPPPFPLPRHLNSYYCQSAPDSPWFFLPDHNHVEELLGPTEAGMCFYTSENTFYFLWKPPKVQSSQIENQEQQLKINKSMKWTSETCPSQDIADYLWGPQRSELVFDFQSCNNKQYRSWHSDLCPMVGSVSQAGVLQPESTLHIRSHRR